MSRTRLPHEWSPSPNYEPRKGKVPSILLLHYTGMESAQAARAWLSDPRSRVSSHYLIDSTGRICQMVDESMRAWHAGVAMWKGESDINSSSIGIEIHNPGHTMGYPDFPEAQMEAVIGLCRDIVERNRIQPQCVLAHSDVAPARKADPGEKFDWAKLYAHGVGHWIEPAHVVNGPRFRVGDSGKDIKELQSHLAGYGYGADITGRFDPATEATIRAFQRHFRPECVDGVADASTVDTLRRLIAALPSGH